MESNKEKKKRNFTVMVVTENEKGHIRQFHLGAGVVKAACFVLAAVVLFCAGYAVSTAVSLSREADTNAVLSAKVEKLTKETEALQLENTELEDKVTLLSETVNSKAQKESEDAEKYIPTGFPLSGTATMLEEQAGAAETDENTEQEAAMDDKEPIVHFAAAGGTAVVATGNGTVAAVEADALYGVCLSIDHGNGYVSVYRAALEPKVKAGDELTKGTMLFEFGTDGGVLGYQIQKDKEFIDPLEMLEISG
ncbi:MAG: peptidoglycan DD-metalloendopeptidase family protein [Clostridiales bacterium]|nr:peptidoglycan DD-metalloendopeptidase family protein [Clostridiales bacterium]